MIRHEVSLTIILGALTTLVGCTHPGDADDTSPTPAGTNTPVSSPTPEPDTSPTPAAACEASAPEYCCSEPVATVSLCAQPGVPDDVPLTGRFLSWEPGLVVFELTDGTQHTFELEELGGGLAALPDLSSYEEIGLIHDGLCTDENGPEDEVYIFTGEYPGTPILQVGYNHHGADLGSGWVVHAETDDSSCPDRPDGSCYSLKRSVPFTFTNDADTYTLRQGASLDVGTTTLQLNAAEYGTGEAVETDCARHTLNYLILTGETE